MKTERRYLWRVIDRGRLRVTTTYLTEEQVTRDYPECTPKALPYTLQVHQVPETAEEAIEAFMRKANQY